MSQVRIIIIDGKVSAFVDGGSFEEAQTALSQLIGVLADLEVSFEEGSPEIERHVHGPDGQHVRRLAKE